MTKKIIINLIIFFNILSMSVSMAKDLTIVADKWMPYNGEPGSVKPGYGIEICKKIFESEGYNIVYRIIPWSRSIKETRYGKYNAIIGASKDEAPDFIFPEEELGISSNAFFVKKDVIWSYKGTDSLKSKTIGLISDYSYGEILDKFFLKNKDRVQYVYGNDPLRKNILKLIAGRIDILIDDANVVKHKASEMNVSGEIIQTESINNNEDDRIYIAFSPADDYSKKYALLFTKGIRRLKKSGELILILNKYGLKYWK